MLAWWVFSWYNTTMSNNTPIREYDANGNEIHYKNSDGFETWYQYDVNNNMIRYKNSSGFEAWYEFDSNNNQIHYKNSDGYESWREYDAKGNCTHYKNSNGVEYWYDSEGNLIDKPTEKKDNTTMSNNEPIRKYDSNGNQIYYKDGKGFEAWYDSDGNEIHAKFSSGYEQWREYNDNGKMIHYKDSDGVEVWYDCRGYKIDKPTEKKDNTTMALKAEETIGLKWSEINSVDWEGNTPIVAYTYDKDDLIVTGIISHEHEGDETMRDYIPVIITDWTQKGDYHFFFNPITLRDGMMHDAWINRNVLINQYEYKYDNFRDDIMSNSAFSPVFVGKSGRLYGLYDMMNYYEDQIEMLKQKIAKL